MKIKKEKKNNITATVDIAGPVSMKKKERIGSWTRYERK